MNLRINLASSHLQAGSRHLILERIEKRLHKFLKRDGGRMFRQFITEEILAKTPDPAEEIAKLKGELATCPFCKPRPR